MTLRSTIFKKIMDAEIDLASDTIKCMILTSTHSDDPDTQEFIDDVDTNEIVDSTGDYTTGGETLGAKTVTVDNTNDWVVFDDTADINLTGTTITNARYYCIYKDTGTPATSPIIAIIDKGSTDSTTNDPFDIEWNASGILRFGTATALRNTAYKKLLEGGIDLSTSGDTIKVMVLDNVHSDNIDTQEFIDDVSANEETSSGYTTGGETLASKTTTTSLGTNSAEFDAADINLTGITFTNARYHCIYKDTGTPATSPILMILDIGQDESPSAAQYNIEWDAAGILRLN